jgi:hypothetical protein
MKKPLFRRCLLFAFGGAASLALAACGGGSDNSEVVAAEPLQRAQALSEPAAPAATGATAATAALLSGDVVASDASAASQEPK